MSAGHLSHFPKPLLEDLVIGRWLPIIGAGMSLNAVVPSNRWLPLWGDLGKALSTEIPDYPYTNPIDAISAYEHEFGRPKLVERLGELLCVEEARPGDAHREFCSIPFDIVCTTNFDFLLEKQYEVTPSYCRPVLDEDQLSSNLRDAGTVLLKLHGDLRHPRRLVVTEEDYDGFISRYPLLSTYLANLLITRTAVLIGYSLDDPDFRQIWSTVTERLGKARRLAYALVVDARDAEVARFERRGVKVINLPGSSSDYGEILSQTFAQLREYFMDNVISVSSVTEEEPLRELSLPRDAVTRLCFFVLPLELHPFYRHHVFPIARECGFVPITADDIVSPGASIAAKIESLIDRSAVVVVDASASRTLAELRMALLRSASETSKTKSRRHVPRVIVVVPEASSIPIELGNASLIRRPDILRADPSDFLTELEKQLQCAATEVSASMSVEPLRLLQAREYRAAVVSAVTLLETTLRRYLDLSNRTSRRPVSQRQLLDMAERAQLLLSGEAEKLLSWLIVRNEVVHSSANVSLSRAREIVHGICDVIRRIQEGAA